MYDNSKVDPICHMLKHKDEPWVDVVVEDRSYVEWLVGGDGPELRTVLYDYLMELLEGRL